MSKLKSLAEAFQYAAVKKTNPEEDVIPSVFSGFGPFVVYKNILPIYVTGSGMWHLPLKDDPSSIALRAQQYGEFLMHQEGIVPYTLPVYNPGLDVGWTDAIRSAAATRIMADSGVTEVRNQPFDDSFDACVFIHQFAQKALTVAGLEHGSPLVDRAVKAIKKLKFPEVAKLLKPSIQMAIDTVAAGGNPVPIIQMLMHLFGCHKEPLQKDYKSLVKEPEQRPLGELIFEQDPDVWWGEFDGVVKLPLSHQAIPKHKVAKKLKRGEAGAFRYPWRALPTSDGQCFAIKRRTEGGTLLIDLSGSMSWSIEDLTTIMRAAPEVIIAGYGSRTNNDVTGGQVVIIGENGQIADVNDVTASTTGGNVVDGHALRWLATMPQPRVWISDGQVTGRNEKQCKALFDDVAMIVKEARIHQIQDVESLLAKLSD